MCAVARKTSLSKVFSKFEIFFFEISALNLLKTNKNGRVMTLMMISSFFVVQEHH